MRGRSLLVAWMAAASLIGCSTHPEGEGQVEAEGAVPSLVIVPEMSADSGGAPSPEAFVAGYREAHRAGNIDAALQLVYWEGVSSRLRSGFARTFRTDFQRELEDAQLVEITNPGPREITTPDGVYRANLEPALELRIEFVREGSPDGEISGRTRPVGVHRGRYYFVSTVVLPPE